MQLFHENTKPSWFTLVELLIVMVIVGILSLLLFRSLGDMTRIAGRIEFEKLLSNNLLTIHTVTNYLSEQYPHIDMTHYSSPWSLFQWYSTGLYLIAKNKVDTASLIFSSNGLELYESKIGKKTPLRDEKKVFLTWWIFRILPTTYYNESIFDLETDTINADWFWIFWSLYPQTKESISQKVSLTIQHFVHLKN